jgi:hypothetical protein
MRDKETAIHYRIFLAGKWKEELMLPEMESPAHFDRGKMTLERCL